MNTLMGDTEGFSMSELPKLTNSFRFGGDFFLSKLTTAETSWGLWWFTVEKITPLKINAKQNKKKKPQELLIVTWPLVENFI